MNASQAIANYIFAKDHNRPHLMRRAFCEAADLQMVVKSGAISFPPAVSGRDGITDVLVRRFGQTYENVHTFCLCTPPVSGVKSFACDWLVGMSSKADGSVRVGCGRYDWAFAEEGLGLATRLKITIEQMLVLHPAALGEVMDWLSSLPHPWCSSTLARSGMPRGEELAAIADSCPGGDGRIKLASGGARSA